MSKETLCQELDISIARLEQMLAILIQKGKIQVIFGEGLSACQDVSACPSTGKACPGPSYCALLMHMPMTVEVVEKGVSGIPKEVCALVITINLKVLAY